MSIVRGKTMKVLEPTRQELQEVIEELPPEILPELANFLEYLRFKINHAPVTATDAGQTMSGSAFLLSIAGLDSSDEVNLAERDEEILANEIDPVRGWGLARENKS